MSEEEKEEEEKEEEEFFKRPGVAQPFVPVVVGVQIDRDAEPSADLTLLGARIAFAAALGVLGAALLLRIDSILRMPNHSFSLLARANDRRAGVREDSMRVPGISAEGPNK